MRAIIILVMILGAPIATAAPFSHRNEFVQVADRHHVRSTPRRSSGHDRPVPRIGDREAAARVRHAYPHYKILSLRLTESANGPPTYRVKTLSPGGVVKFVYVDAMTGKLFE